MRTGESCTVGSTMLVRHSTRVTSHNDSTWMYYPAPSNQQNVHKSQVFVMGSQLQLDYPRILCNYVQCRNCVFFHPTSPQREMDKRRWMVRDLLHIVSQMYDVSWQGTIIKMWFFPFVWNFRSIPKNRMCHDRCSSLMKSIHLSRIFHYKPTIFGEKNHIHSKIRAIFLAQNVQKLIRHSSS